MSEVRCSKCNSKLCEHLYGAAVFKCRRWTKDRGTKTLAYINTELGINITLAGPDYMETLPSAVLTDAEKAFYSLTFPQWHEAP